MNYTKRLDDLQKEIIEALCRIEEIPAGLLPHCVYVEEENENSLECGNSVYSLYKLTKILPKGKCVLENSHGKEEIRDLYEINIDWLITVWNYYKDLSGIKEPQPIKKELCVFVYPVDGFERNMPDEEILELWENGEAEKYTPDEFAELINDEMFNDVENWVRFIEVEN